VTPPLSSATQEPLQNPPRTKTLVPPMLAAFIRSLAPRAPRTLKTYGAVVASFFAFLGHGDAPTQPPTRADVETFLARPRADGGPRSAAGRNQELAALRAYSAFAERELGWSASPTEGLPFAREAPHDPVVLSLAEVRRLFTAAAETSEGWERSRNLALLALLGQAALRVHELVRLDLTQVDLGSATLVAVRGKGATVHDIPLSPPCVALLSAYLPEREAHAADGETALFVSTSGRLSARTVQRLLERLREPMGTAKRITPHSLRHSVATLALTQGADLVTVAELLRHSDVNTTRRYIHLIDAQRREAVRRLGAAVPPELLAGAVRASPGGGAERLAEMAPVPPAAAPREASQDLPLTQRDPLPKLVDVQCGLDDT
jgi:site-specific recombinase XerD